MHSLSLAKVSLNTGKSGLSRPKPASVTDVKRGIAAVVVEIHEVDLEVELSDLGQDWLVLEKAVCRGRVLGVEGIDADGADAGRNRVGVGWSIQVSSSHCLGVIGAALASFSWLRWNVVGCERGVKDVRIELGV